MTLHVLRPAGRRRTSQRELLFRLIQENREHLDVDGIYRLAKREYPRLSISTVYRTLSLLKELNLVRELHLEEEHHHYEARDPGGHFHLICKGCGQVIEFSSPLAEELKHHVARDKDFQVSDVQIDITGLCRECRAGERPG
ncbi:MAG: Fur family transcriptional regulator [Chloroflexota bacterium]